MRSSREPFFIKLTCIILAFNHFTASSVDKSTSFQSALSIGTDNKITSSKHNSNLHQEGGRYKTTNTSRMDVLIKIKKNMPINERWKLLSGYSIEIISSLQTDTSAEHPQQQHAK